MLSFVLSSSQKTCNLGKCSWARHFCMDGYGWLDGPYDQYLRWKLNCQYLSGSRIRASLTTHCANSKSPLLLFLYWWSLDGCKLRIHSVRLNVHDSLYITVRAMNSPCSLRTLRSATAFFRVGHIYSSSIVLQTIVLFVSVILVNTLIQSVSYTLYYLHHFWSRGLTEMASPTTWRGWCESLQWVSCRGDCLTCNL